MNPVYILFFFALVYFRTIVLRFICAVECLHPFLLLQSSILLYRSTTVCPSTIGLFGYLVVFAYYKWSSYNVNVFKSVWTYSHAGMITHLEPDILECKVKWALGSITMNKAGGGGGIPVELFQILKDDAVKVLHSICQQIWKTQQWPQDWKRSVFIPNPKK